MAYHPQGGSAVYCAKKLVDMSIYLTRSDWKCLPNCLIKMCHYSSPGWLSKEKGTGNFLFAFWRYGVVECHAERRILFRAIILHSLMMEWPPMGLWFIDWRQLKSLLHLASVIKNYSTCFLVAYKHRQTNLWPLIQFLANLSNVMNLSNALILVLTKILAFLKGQC